MVDMPYYINAKTPSEAWVRALDVIYRNGRDIIAGHEQKTREVLGLLIHVQKPFENRLHPLYPLKEEAVRENYVPQLLTPENPTGFVYTYGERLRDYNVEENRIDQINEVIKILSDLKESRRAIAITWYPWVDLYAEDIPCLIVADFKVRNDKLHLTCYLRSNDLGEAWMANQYAFSELGKYVGEKVGVEMSSLTTFSNSAHYYDHFKPTVEKILEIR